MNRLTIEKQVQVISALVEGNSLRSVVRMTGVAMNTIQKLLAELGHACTEYQDKVMRNLNCKHTQCDEIWEFCYAKDKNVPADKRGYARLRRCVDVGCLGRRYKAGSLVYDWYTKRTDGQTAKRLMDGLASRLANRVQLTTDGHRAYLEAVEGAFGCNYRLRNAGQVVR